jgi:hypothetical protein
MTDLSVLREVALHSARQAITTHERRRLRRRQQLKLALAGLGLGLGAAETLFPNHAVGSPTLGLAAMTVGCLALAWWLATAVACSRRLLGDGSTKDPSGSATRGATGSAQTTDPAEQASPDGPPADPTGDVGRTLCQEAPESGAAGEP